MEKPTPAGTFFAPTDQAIGARGAAGAPHPPPKHRMSAPRVGVARPTRVLICVGDAGVRELIGLLLVDAGCAITSMDVLSWIDGNTLPEPPPEVLILDAWPLRHADAATQACVRLEAQPAALVLLLDSLQPFQLAAQLGAVATLPLLFTLQELITAVEQGADAHSYFQDSGSHSIGVQTARSV